MNTVALVGRLTKDPELRYIEVTGTPVADFTIAVNRDFAKKDGTREADFIPIEVMGKTAEFCANYLTKGRLISCVGQIRVNNYQAQDGSRRTFTFVSCRSVNPLEKAKDTQEQPQSEPAFEPPGFNEVDIPF